MNESGLCGDIKQNLEEKGISITKKETELLYSKLMSQVSEILSNGDILNISGFGSFRKKNTESLPVISFMPSDTILKRINERK